MTNPIIAQFQLNYSEFQLNVDLRLPDSGVTVLFGHSGSGKTSLLRCIAGLQHAAQGFLQINDHVWQDSEKSLFLPTHQRPLGYVFQEANLFPHLTVSGNLCYGLKRIGQKADTAHFLQVMDLLGIVHLMERMPERLSGGERQRVAIARALVLNPEILLMDEPLASLDEKRKQEILPFLKRLHQELKIPVLYVTHSQQEVAQLADYLVILKEGKVVAADVLTEALSNIKVALSGQYLVSSVWTVTVLRHDERYHLTEVSSAAGVLYLPRVEADIGAQLRLQIDAKDVSVTLEKPVASSILNILPAIVAEITEDTKGQTLLQLHIGQHKLLAQITKKSAHNLNLQKGITVYAQIKGTSIANG